MGERHERKILVNGKHVPATDQLFWAGYSCAFNLPATVAPIGLTASGLPVGVQIVGPQYLGYEQEARHRVAHMAPQPKPGERLIGWTLEGSACWRHQHVIVAAEALDSHGCSPRQRMLRANSDYIALAVKHP